MILKDLFRSSGGLYYHARAFWNRDRWRPFTESLGKALYAWPCPKTELVLFAPSAGYSLPTPWLCEFSRLTAFDLDPLAGPLFRRCHPGVRVRFYRADLFWRNARLSMEPIQEILQRHPEATLLFCNVLGQLLADRKTDEQDWGFFLSQLRTTLKGRHWASYHDLYTYENDIVIDHLLDFAWSSGLKKSDLEWNLTASSRHHVQFVCESPTNYKSSSPSSAAGLAGAEG